MNQIIIDFGALTVFGREFPLRIFGYGLMMVLGFITSLWLAQRRAARTGASEQVVSALAMMGLIGGILGARLAFVIENWRSFSDHPNPLVEVLNITSGGLIYYGGVALAVLGALGYLLVKKLSIRRYLDILAPCLMIGLAFGRTGCFLNGCCFGGPADESSPFAIRFPMFSRPLLKLDGSPGPFSSAMDSPSPVFAHQLATGRLTAADIDPRLLAGGMPMPPRHLHGKLDAGDDQLRTAFLSKDQLHEMFLKLTGGRALMTEADWRRGLSLSDGPIVSGEAWPRAEAFAKTRSRSLTFDEFYSYSQDRRADIVRRFDTNDDAKLDDTEKAAANDWLRADLWRIAADQKSLPVKPAQPLGIINALLIAALLLYYSRLGPKAGQVFAAMMVLKSITRFALEIVRDDNAHSLSQLVFTHNQVSSMLILIGGVAFWMIAARMAPPAPEPVREPATARRSREKSPTKG